MPTADNSPALTTQVESKVQVKACCNDPIVWTDSGRWYAITAQHGAGGTQHANYGKAANIGLLNVLQRNNVGACG